MPTPTTPNHSNTVPSPFHPPHTHPPTHPHADFCHDFASLDDDVMSEVQHIGCEGYYTTDVGCPIAVDGSYWYDDDTTCADFCESFSVDAVCVGAHEYDDNQCGSDLVQVRAVQNEGR